MILGILRWGICFCLSVWIQIEICKKKVGFVVIYFKDVFWSINKSGDIMSVVVGDYDVILNFDVEMIELIQLFVV